MFTHNTKILNTNSHPAAELRGIRSIKKQASFTALKLNTIGYKFNLEEANER